MATGGTTTGGDLVGIDAEFGGVLADPADGGLAVFDAFDGGGAVRFFDAVFGGDGDHAFLGEVFTVGIELGGASADPTAAEEEDDGGCFVGGFVVLRVEDVELEGDVADGLEGDLVIGSGGRGEGGEGEEGGEEDSVEHGGMEFGWWRGLKCRR